MGPVVSVNPRGGRESRGKIVSVFPGRGREVGPVHLLQEIQQGRTGFLHSAASLSIRPSSHHIPRICQQIKL